MEKTNWNEIVEKSKGKSLFLPDSFTAKAKEWNDKREELNNLIGKAAKIEVQTQAALQVIILEVRTYLEENGHPGVWSKDVGFNSDALDEGKYIVEITDPLPGQR